MSRQAGNPHKAPTTVTQAWEGAVRQSAEALSGVLGARLLWSISRCCAAYETAEEPAQTGLPLCKAVLQGGPPTRGGAKRQKVQEVRQTAGLFEGLGGAQRGDRVPESSGWQGPAWYTPLGREALTSNVRRLTCDAEWVEGAHLRGSTVRTTV